MNERSGRTFVYVLPSLGENLVKLGMTYDPFDRFRTFHPRFYDHFDLEQGLLLETPQLQDARRIERLFIERWSLHRASAPTIVEASAGGSTEWFRGIEQDVMPFAARIADRYGYPLHAPLKTWLRRKLAEQQDVLFQWSLQVFDGIQWQALHRAGARDLRAETMLRNMLDMYVALDFSLQALVPGDVFLWHQARIPLP